MCHGVWSGKNSWYWMAREQAWPPTEHSSSDPAPVVATHADIVPSVAPGGNVKVMLSKMAPSQVLDPTHQSRVASQLPGPHRSLPECSNGMTIAPSLSGPTSSLQVPCERLEGLGVHVEVDLPRPVRRHLTDGLDV